MINEYDVIELVFSVIAALIALTVHEYCHGYAAYKLGDDTAKNFGRLTLNPLKHIDPYGAICMVLFHIGWAKPVPINARNFRDPKKGFAITAAAGPAANLILAFFTGFLLLLAYTFCVPGTSTFYMSFSLFLFLKAFYSINLGLGIFNLLPIPPFDGSRLLYIFLPPKIYFEIMKYERKIYFGVLAWLLLGDNIALFIRTLPLVANNDFLYLFAGIFSLSEIISTVISAVSSVILGFWKLIPFFSNIPL